MLTTIAFDGDDTLWHNERIFAATQARFEDLLRPYAADVDIHDRLFRTEKKNLALFGYGVKGFTLSMIETALEITDHRIHGESIARILQWGREMLAEPVEPLTDVRETLQALHGSYHLIVITKGDLFDQENKVARSGLADLFNRVEIVSEKDEATYRDILARSGTKPEAFVMVGNSLRSDILPVLSLGARAVHIEYEITWAHEDAEKPADSSGRFWRLDHIGALPSLIRRIDAMDPMLRS
ncbi:HAD family hydrolase [Fodinicurvata sp. EGI_FJ10296]|uniref:HAD family hydrolase n=1 Tax=Fodinicurvata sp. EGI_FJ10296 TaxID=3231908 RepID=UPI0034558B97